MVRFLILISNLFLLPNIALAENLGSNIENDPSLPLRAAKGDPQIRVVSVDRVTDAVRPKLLRPLPSVREIVVNSK